MTSSSVQKGEIWLAYVEFANHEGVGKVRPALVLAIENDDSSAIVAKVTATANWPESEYIAIPNWAQCGLRKPSFVQLNPLFSIQKDKILREEPLGSISPELLALVIQKINLSSLGD